jgi:outer membrane lipoprotein-sorting protein
MKSMTRLKVCFTLTIGAATLAADGAELALQEIIEKSKNAYASLSSYSDKGKTVASIGTNKVAPHEFSIRLARPGLYRIQWSQDSGSFKHSGAAWSSGDGDFFVMDGQQKPQKYPDRIRALAAATGVSGNAAASIPGTFFKHNWGNQLNASMYEARTADEKIGDTDCYVLTGQKDGQRRTLWIGKKDFLIRQVQNDSSADALRKALDAQPNKPRGIQIRTGDSKSVETHMNIVINQPFSKTDFTPSDVKP